MGLLQQMIWGGRTTPTYPYEWYYADTNFYLSAYEKAQNSETVLAADRYTIITSNLMQMDVDGTGLTQYSSQSIDLSVATNWDDYYNDSDWDSTNYTTAANRKGLDFYLYAVVPSVGSVPKFLASASSTYPIGYLASTSRLIGGFHCFCNSMSTPSAWVASTNYALGSTVVPTVANGKWYRCVVDAGSAGGSQPTWPTTVGTTVVDSGITWVCESTHSLSGYVTGDVLPMSIWDLNHRSAATYGNKGQVYNPETEEWCGIYMTSGTYLAPTIIYSGASAIIANIDWTQVMDAGRRLGMRLPSDHSFQSLAEGSNCMTVVSSVPNPIYPVEYSDTVARRMVSNIGCESCCGLLNQWMNEQFFQFISPTAHTHNVTTTGVAGDFLSATASVDVAPAWSWSTTIPNHKGQSFKQGSSGDVKMVGGGSSSDSSYGGPRSRRLENHRWNTSALIGFRLVADSIER
jgi:hypothetical protein